jgi:hypothetical protein
MYKLSLNNEELHSLRDLLERSKARVDKNPRGVQPWSPYLEAVLTKLVIAQIDAADEAIAEARAERYAMNLHSRPEGA